MSYNIDHIPQWTLLPNSGVGECIRSDLEWNMLKTWLRNSVQGNKSIRSFESISFCFLWGLTLLILMTQWPLILHLRCHNYMLDAFVNEGLNFHLKLYFQLMHNYFVRFYGFFIVRFYFQNICAVISMFKWNCIFSSFASNFNCWLKTICCMKFYLSTIIKHLEGDRFCSQ